MFVDCALQLMRVCMTRYVVDLNIIVHSLNCHVRSALSCIAQLWMTVAVFSVCENNERTV